MKTIVKFLKNQWEQSSLFGKVAMVLFAIFFCTLILPAATILTPIPFILTKKPL